MRYFHAKCMKLGRSGSSAHVYDSKMLHVDADIFLNMEGKVSVFKNTQLCLDGQI